MSHSSVFVIASNSFLYIMSAINCNAIQITRQNSGKQDFDEVLDLTPVGVKVLEARPKIKNNLLSGNILIMNNNFTNISGDFMVGASIINIGVVFNCSWWNGVDKLTYRGLAVPALDISTYLDTSKISAEAEKELFETSLINHATLGTLRLNRMGVNITGNRLINVSIGVNYATWANYYLGSVYSFTNVARIDITSDFA